MEFLEYVIHLDKNISLIVNNFGVWSYIFLGFVVFCETGLFLAPFLPEESLLFITGTLAAKKVINITIVCITLMIMNVLGEAVNFFIGRRYGERIFKSNDSIIFNKKQISRAIDFFNTHAGSKIIFAKYIPIVRTFIPFVAGMAKMKFRTFLLFNLIGGIPWVAIFLFGGYFLGNVPFISNNFSIVVVIVIAIPIIPWIISYLKLVACRIKKS